jgi:hypothetical protein
MSEPQHLELGTLVKIVSEFNSYPTYAAGTSELLSHHLLLPVSDVYTLPGYQDSAQRATALCLVHTQNGRQFVPTSARLEIRTVCHGDLAIDLTQVTLLNCFVLRVAECGNRTYSSCPFSLAGNLQQEYKVALAKLPRVRLIS